MPTGQTVKNKLAASKEFYDTSYHQVFFLCNKKIHL